jgi:hypothetical protein
MKKTYTKLMLLLTMIISLNSINAQEKTFDVDEFDGVIISPHVEVIFIQAEEESVVIENIDVSMDKLNVEVKGKTLHIYLDDAKVYTKSEKVKYDDYKSKHAIYDGTVVSAKVYYKSLELISLRGEETHKVESPLTGDKLSLKIYGESDVFISEVNLKEFHATIYGEAYLEVKEGTAERQRLISYGDSEVNTLGVNNNSAKVTAYGEGRIRLNVSDDLKITAYGEASIHYKGSPMLNHGLIIGEARIHQIN